MLEDDWFYPQESIEAMRLMTVDDYKSKEIGLVCDLLVSMKLICTGCGNQFTIQVSTICDMLLFCTSCLLFIVSVYDVLTVITL